jgi:hypothetical protein
MSPLPRRAWRARVALAAWTGVLATTVGVAPAGAHGGPCSGATVTRHYAADSMTFRLDVNFAGCRWWNGSPRNLVIWLSRDDGNGPADRWNMTTCPTACEVSAALPHEVLEQTVTYQGEAAWEWKDGTRRVSFETHCTTTADGRAGCEDPVDTWHD